MKKKPKKPKSSRKPRERFPAGPANSVAVATLNGMLDAVSGAAADAGLQTEVPALRAVFGILIGGAIERARGTTLNIEGVGRVKIRPADAQAVAMGSFAQYAQLLTAKTLREQVKAKK